MSVECSCDTRAGGIVQWAIMGGYLIRFRFCTDPKFQRDQLSGNTDTVGIDEQRCDGGDDCISWRRCCRTDAVGMAVGRNGR